MLRKFGQNKSKSTVNFDSQQYKLEKLKEFEEEDLDTPYLGKEGKSLV